VHISFYADYLSVKNKVLAAVQNLVSIYPTARVVVTGHSLGAAMATYGAIDLSLLGYGIYFYTYGSPRPGNDNFAIYFNSMITLANMRSVYIDDPVPALPPHSIWFRHVGTKVHFTSCSDFIVYPAYKDDLPNPNLL